MVSGEARLKNGAFNVEPEPVSMTAELLRPGVAAAGTAGGTVRGCWSGAGA
jgi:hypothetical protein